MQRVILSRILNTIPVLLIVSLVSFILLHLAPGDPVSMYMSNDLSTANPADVARVRQAMGLDEPLPVQYALWLGHALQGDLGFSLTTRRPVLTIILEALPNSLLLTSVSLALAILVGLVLGVLTAIRQNSWLDYLITTLAFIGYSVPSFYLALLLLFLFSFEFKVLPSSGMFSLRAGNIAPPVDLLQHLIMPVIASTLVQLVVWVRFQRNSLLEVMSLDYLRTARAKGLAERVVIFRHAWRNSLIPLATQLGLSFSYLIGGSFIIESIFAWPGMGRLGIESIQFRDYPVSMGILLLSASMIVLGNLLADIAYGFLDPKITFQWKALG